MARRRHVKSGRTLDWHLGLTNTQIFPNSSGTPSTVTASIITPITQGEHVTVTRIVGNIWAFVDSTDSGFNVTGTQIHTMNMGIQVVNRAKGIIGVARDPFLADDREGSEWMWMRHQTFAWQINGASGIPPDDFIAFSGFNEDIASSAVDITVQRKFDLSQDELVLAASTLTHFGASISFRVVANLRVLIRNS